MGDALSLAYAKLLRHAYLLPFSHNVLETFELKN
jgi:hypothetical protein